MRNRLVFPMILVALGACSAPAGTSSPAPALATQGPSTLALSAASRVDCTRDASSCSVKVPVVVENGLAHPVTIDALTATRAGTAGETTRWEYEPVVVPAHGTWTLSPTLYAGDEWTLRVFATGPTGEALTASTTLGVRDSELERAVAACDACHGKWGSWGMMGTQACNCETKDAGKVCHDQSDCEGDCLQPRVELLDAATYRLVGSCSAHTMTFGCLARVRPGTYPVRGAVHFSSGCSD